MRRQLLRAIAAGDHTRLSQLMAVATIKESAGTFPLSLYHAAALHSDAEAVGLLAAAGVPRAVANSVCHGPSMISCLSLEGSTVGQLFSNFCGTALGIAARQGNSAVVAALLAAGAAIDRGSPQVPGVSCSSATPLEIVAYRAAEFGAPRTQTLLHQLLAGDATVSPEAVAALEAVSSSASQMLAQHLQQQLDARQPDVAVLEAVKTGDMTRLRTWLAHSRPSFEAPMPEWFSVPFRGDYPCPVLAALQNRIRKVSRLMPLRWLPQR